MAVHDDDNPYASPQTIGNSPRQERLGTPPPSTGAANLAIWLFLLPVFLGLALSAVFSVARWLSAR